MFYICFCLTEYYLMKPNKYSHVTLYILLASFNVPLYSCSIYACIILLISFYDLIIAIVRHTSVCECVSAFYVLCYHVCFLRVRCECLYTCVFCACAWVYKYVFVYAHVPVCVCARARLCVCLCIRISVWETILEIEVASISLSLAIKDFLKKKNHNIL